MKNKRILIGISISLIPLLAGCSYGGSAVLSHDNFITFYEQEELNLQADRLFALGDSISVNSTFIDGDENVHSESFALSTGSIDRWISETKGSTLSYAYAWDIKDSNKVQLESKKYSSSLGFSSNKVVDDEDQEKVTTTETYTYKYDLNNVHGTDEVYDECDKVSENTSYSIAYLSEDLGKTVKTTTKTWSSTITMLQLYDEYDEITDVTTTYKMEENFSFVYVESKTGLLTETSLTYSSSSISNVREEVIGGSGVISGDKTIHTTTESTTIDEASDTDVGVLTNKESVYHWNGSEYIKDEGSSHEDPDDTTFRYEVEQNYLDSFQGAALFNAWQIIPQLADFLAGLSNFYSSLYTGFEIYLNGNVENEEIVKEGLTYQYRSLLSSNLNTYEIMQYTFVKPSDDTKQAYLSDISNLIFDSASDTSVVMSRVSIVY
ncbi:MAG: hypothetical protein PHW23_01800 [Bacilli bacterium]|nr:hypothetical protein [Bacilli bacterium]